MLRAKCMKARSIRAGSNPAGSRGAIVGTKYTRVSLLFLFRIFMWTTRRPGIVFHFVTFFTILSSGGGTNNCQLSLPQPHAGQLVPT